MIRSNPISRARLGGWLAVMLMLGSLCMAPRSAVAEDWPSGEMLVPQGAVETAIDGQTGNLIFQMEPANAPFPTHTNESAQAPLYFTVYPLNSAVPANNLNCQPTNCDHLNVLPFADPNYGALSGSMLACQDFNQGNPCSEIKGHDHLRGVSASSGNPTTQWAAYLAVFTTQGFDDGAINNRITTVSQLYSLITRGDVVIFPAGVTVTLAPASPQTYQLGTPLQVTYP